MDRRRPYAVARDRWPDELAITTRLTSRPENDLLAIVPAPFSPDLDRRFHLRRSRIFVLHHFCVLRVSADTDLQAPVISHLMRKHFRMAIEPTQTCAV